MWCCTWCDHLLVSVVCPKLDASFIAEMAVFLEDRLTLRSGCKEPPCLFLCNS